MRQKRRRKFKKTVLTEWWMFKALTGIKVFSVILIFTFVYLFFHSSLILLGWGKLFLHDFKSVYKINDVNLLTITNAPILEYDTQLNCTDFHSEECEHICVSWNIFSSEIVIMHQYWCCVYYTTNIMIIIDRVDINSTIRIGPNWGCYTLHI